MTVNLTLTREQEAQVARKAQQDGVPVDDYLQTLVRKDIGTTEGLTLTLGEYDREAVTALLDAFDSSDEWGTADEQRETLEYLETAIDADRPGQRRIFGKGYNP